jgi:hypothetical protein
MLIYLQLYFYRIYIKGMSGVLTLNVRLIEKHEEKIISIHFLDQFFTLITMEKKFLKNFQYWVN